MKNLLKLKYKEDQYKIDPPLLRHIDRNFLVVEAYLLEQGKGKDGLPYQIIKVKLKDGVIA